MPGPINSNLSDELGALELASPEQPSPLSQAEAEVREPVPPLYSIYTTWQKRSIVLAAALTAVFSSLTIQIYLPALNVLAHDFQVSDAQINLTVTTYMVFQGLVPMFVGEYADRVGRLPAYIACFVVYTIANVGLALSRNYASLLGLRCLQSAGAAATQALCSAVVADIITSSERGHYTCRRVVGDGSIVPPRINQTLWQLLRSRHKSEDQYSATTDTRLTDEDKRPKPSLSLLFQFLILLHDKHFTLLLLYSGLTFAGMTGITTTLPSQLAANYGLTSLQVGLVYLPMVAGSVVAAVVVGRGLNWNFTRYMKRLGLPIDKSQKRRQLDLSSFPVERARMEIALPPLLLSVGVMISWGWVFESHTSLAVPCVMCFLALLKLISSNNSMSALVADIYPGKVGSAMAANNITRCALGATMAAVIQPMINAVGTGWAFTIIGGLYIFFSPLIVIFMLKGMKWRMEIRLKEDARNGRSPQRD
ncbi:major facilitator superfamily domain-containing protein [Xylariales sp. PMI_506]|nr:major facilitator superfamily domain-containing protein [Xylariales sp. PMI_506]